jgi:hypothetical protein
MLRQTTRNITPAKAALGMDTGRQAEMEFKIHHLNSFWIIPNVSLAAASKQDSCPHSFPVSSLCVDVVQVQAENEQTQLSLVMRKENSVPPLPPTAPPIGGDNLRKGK